MDSQLEKTRSIIKRSALFMIVMLGIVFLSVAISSCTYSITMVHTEGTASDVVDETATNSPNVSPDIKIPITP